MTTAAFGYGVLVWAAGGNPRTLDCPGHDLAGVHAIRNKADCDRLMAVLPHSRRIAVIGGGYVGLEAAAVLSEMGKEVAVVETLDRVLARVAAEPVSRFYEAEHRAHGVRAAPRHPGHRDPGTVRRRHRRAPRRRHGDRRRPSDRRRRHPCPRSSHCSAPGRRRRSRAAGVLVDDLCRTTLPDVYCVGDCAVLRNGPGIRIESRHNACEQAHTAAKAISGHARSHCGSSPGSGRTNTICGSRPSG